MTIALATRWFVTNTDGSISTDLDTRDLGPILAQLDQPTSAHAPSVALTNDNGWSLRASQSGRLILSRPGETDHHLRGATRELVAGLWACLAACDLDTIEAQSWRPFHDGR